MASLPFAPLASTTQNLATHFVYQRLGRNGSIIAEIQSVQGTAGLMLCGSLESGGPAASLVVSSTGGVSFVARDATSAASSSGTVDSTGATWLKLQRSGNRVTGYSSADGIHWKRIGSASLSLADSSYAGLAVTGQTGKNPGIAQFSNTALTDTQRTASATRLDLTTSAKAAVIGTGSGLKAQIFRNLSRTGRHITRVDSVVDFNWGAGTPDQTISAAPFSVRWSGKVLAEYSDVYALTVHSDAGAKLFINGKLVINSVRSPMADTVSLPMVAGRKYNIRLVYQEAGGKSDVSLLWNSTHQASEVIPQSQLYAAAA